MYIYMLVHVHEQAANTFSCHFNWLNKKKEVMHVVVAIDISVTDQ